ncbi:MAG: SGNH/GDSL hydrolase family protein [Verrucomicrobiota bacterium]
MRKNLRPILGAAFWLVAFSTWQIFAAEKDDPIRWEKDIQQFEAADKTNPPPRKAILFIGSSSISIWKTLATDFPEHKVINRGFGGSHLSDSVFYFDRVVVPYKPKMIVIYAGGNDINAGKTPEDVFGAFTNFVAKAHRALPKTRVAYISIAPNPARWAQVEQVKAANKLIEDFCKKKSKLKFINVFPEMLGADGKPKPDIFVADKLHMNANGYALWVPIVRPYLKK